MVILARRNLRRFWGSDGTVRGRRSLFIHLAFWNRKRQGPILLVRHRYLFGGNSLNPGEMLVINNRNSVKNKANAGKSHWLLLQEQSFSLTNCSVCFPLNTLVLRVLLLVFFFFKVNKADAASLDAGDVYSAVKLYGLTVVAKEIYEQGAYIKKNKLCF